MRIRGWLLGFAWFLGCVGEPAELEEPLDMMTIAGDGGPAADDNLASDAGCGPGLHRVKQRVQVFDDDSTSSCSFTPVPAFVCLEGFCGDGRCEAPEAVVCGCSLDCPID